MLSSGAGLNRSVSRSTELLHVSRQDSATGRRSWDSLVPDKKKSLDSPSASGPEGVTYERTRFSTCLSPSVLGNNSPWFGGSSESKGYDTPTRLLLGGTIPRSILALSDRPVTYEEELEERLGLLRVSARTLYQRLASEKKLGKELTHQLNARELNYREVVEKMRSQYDQRFERLKNRARLLVTRCELLRSEKQQLETRLAQAMQNAIKERQAMERRITILEDEVERLRSEQQEQELPELKVVEDADIEEERKAEEEKRKAKEEEEGPKMKEKQEKAEEGNDNAKEGEKRNETEDGQEIGVKGEDKKAEDKETEDLKESRCGRNHGTGSANDHYKILCEIAVARVAWLEELLRSNFDAKSSSANNYVRVEPPSLLARRSSSCPMLADGVSHRPSSEEDLLTPISETYSDPLTIQRPRRELPRERIGLTGSDRGGVIRFKANTIATTRLLTNSQSMPPTIGHPKPAKPSTTTIRQGLQKLFASGRPNNYDTTFVAWVPLSEEGKQPRVTTRIDTPSDDELPLDLLHLDAKIKHSRRTPKKTKGGASFDIPALKAKRTASLPKMELFRKFQTAGRQERDGPSFVGYQDSFQTTQVPLTKQERILGVRLDRLTSDKVSSNSSLMAKVQDLPTSQTPPTKQERVLGVRLDRHEFDKVSPNSSFIADVQDIPTNQVTLTKQERVLGVRLECLASDKVSSTSDVVLDVPVSNFSSHVNKESTESLPEKVEELDGESKVRCVKRNRSVHSTFGRLHQRRNGITDIARLEQKATKPPSPLDSLGKNLKQYLH